MSIGGPFDCYPVGMAPNEPQRGQFYSLLPPRQLSLRELVIRAVEAAAALHDYRDSMGEDEWTRRDEAQFDARAELRAALMNLGLDKGLIDALGDVL